MRDFILRCDINLLMIPATNSTLLLGASNAACQILAAPLREEVDKAHSQGKWMHIGVFDFLNLRFITWKRIVLCGLIALSSIPLHLL